MTWDALQQYLHTWSSLHTYHESYPDDLKRSDGDISARLWKSLKDGVEKEGNAKDKEIVEVEWPLALLLVKRT